ncbi:MAG: peptidylprolyl isomerase [Oculatellaceae cyanobacterium bins.114]|nr:peptidylprolyl isomerase [Oculatellaceae cyanobacterium bins.114]
MIDALKRWLRAGMVSVLLLLALTLNVALESSPAAASSISTDILISRLPAGNPISDGKALLRYALPIDNGAVRKLQVSLEEISTTLRVSRKRLSSINGNLTQAERILSRKAELLASVPSDRQPQAETLITELGEGIATIRADIEAQNRDAIWAKRSELLDKIGELEELMVTGFPYEVPAEYSNLPQLKGRATIEFKTSKGAIEAIVDGYSAPVTAGNFVDLVKRGFYDGLPFTRAEESYVLQVGDPPGPDVGFIDPDTGKYRAVPLEVLVKGDKEPTYGITLEDAGRFLEQPVLPFSAYGALALARPSSDPNGGSSQFFFFLFEPELTPAGANLLDGRYSIFGYVTQGKDVLEKLKAGDLIESAQVLDGLENLVEPTA